MKENKYHDYDKKMSEMIADECYPYKVVNESGELIQQFEEVEDAQDFCNELNEGYQRMKINSVAKVKNVKEE